MIMTRKPMRRPRRMRGVAAALCMTALLALPISTAAAQHDRPDQGDQGDREVATLSVRGTALLSRPADELQISVGVVTEAADAADSLHQNSRRMQEVITALEAAGVAEDEYQTSQFQIRPVYEPRPRTAEADWSPRIKGYEVTNSVEIKTRRLDDAGRIIDAATGAGANTINSISFGLADHRKYRSEAIATATTNAIGDARVLAGAASLRLVRILSVQLDGAEPRPIDARARKIGRASCRERV